MTEPPTGPFAPAAAEVFRASLLQWYDAHGRPLPWRTEVSFYRTLVSEFMCQQTQVDSAMPYFLRWMERFPDMQAVAAASEEEILQHWEGLGYYTRARNLHACCKILAGQAQVPASAVELRALPGVGPYTAAALSSIHHGEVVPVIDGNVIRVLSRICGIKAVYRSSQEAARRLAAAAQSLVDPGRPGDFNQAMMELGARLCTKQKPQCLFCPVERDCTSSNDPELHRIPSFVRRKVARVEVERLWLVDHGRLLLQAGKVGSNGEGGLFELPLVEPSCPPPEAALGEPVFEGRRGIAHRLYTERVRRVNCKIGIQEWVRKQDGLRWVELDRLETVTMSGPHRRWVREILQREGT